jgi:hypothetical protein
MKRRGWAWFAAAAGVAALGLYWLAGGAQEPAATAPPAPRPTAAAAASAPASGGFMQAANDQRRQQLALWQQRLERAQATLAAYTESTRYPHESQPAAAHADQMHPNRPVEEALPLRLSSGKTAEGLTLHTSQERVFVQGSETVRFALSVRDRDGQAQPLRIVRAGAREVPAPRTAPTYPGVPMPFNDDASNGDLAAGDRVYSAALQPATQGFAGLHGQIRVEAFLEVAGQQAYTYFDIVYTPDAPATWLGEVREALEAGSLNFYLKAQVQQAGRYVVSARVDDANGVPFALLGFNDELASGSLEVRLVLFGKLVRDGQPAFPLRLRDVEGFLLIPDAFPDRRLMPRLAGSVHTSNSYALSSFSDVEWSSEERTRYLNELSRDVREVQDKVAELGKGG